MTVVTDVLSSEEVEVLSDKLDRQAEAERALGDLSPVDNELPMQSLSNLVNKGQHFLELVANDPNFVSESYKSSENPRKTSGPRLCNFSKITQIRFVLAHFCLFGQISL